MAFNLIGKLQVQTDRANLQNVSNLIKKSLGNFNAKVNLTFSNSSRSVGTYTRSLDQLHKTIQVIARDAPRATAAINQLNNSFYKLANVAVSLPRNIDVTNKTIDKTARAVKGATSEMEKFGRQSAETFKKFFAIGASGAVIYGIVNATIEATKNTLLFQHEMTKLKQVVDGNAIATSSLSKEITKLSKEFGSSSNELGNVALTLAQAGLTAQQTKQALDSLAKSTLLPSFDNLTNTTEGLIAIMGQFRDEVRGTGIQVSDFEEIIGSINAVSAAFAVEADDIVTAIRGAGAVFAQASPEIEKPIESLNKLIAVFTTVRSSTRESAESITSGLRTIFARIQRKDTIEYLRQFGIQLTEVGKNGEEAFVGPVEAIKRLNEGIAQLSKSDIRLPEIAEQVAGIRQLSKFLPLIRSASQIDSVLTVASRGGVTTAKALQIGQESLTVEINKTKEAFLGLIKSLQGDQFQSFVRTVLKVTQGLIGAADAAKDLAKYVVAIGAIKLAPSVASFGRGFYRQMVGSDASGPLLFRKTTDPNTRAKIESDNRVVSSLDRLNDTLSGKSTVGANAAAASAVVSSGLPSNNRNFGKARRDLGGYNTDYKGRTVPKNESAYGFNVDSNGNRIYGSYEFDDPTNTRPTFVAAAKNGAFAKHRANVRGGGQGLFNTTNPTDEISGLYKDSGLSDKRRRAAVRLTLAKMSKGLDIDTATRQVENTINFNETKRASRLRGGSAGLAGAVSAANAKKPSSINAESVTGYAVAGGVAASLLGSYIKSGATSRSGAGIGGALQGFGGGAVTGALLGGQVGGVYGAAGGAIVGGAVGGISGFMDSVKEFDRNKIFENLEISAKGLQSAFDALSSGMTAKEVVDNATRIQNNDSGLRGLAVADKFDDSGSGYKGGIPFLRMALSEEERNQQSADTLALRRQGFTGFNTTAYGYNDKMVGLDIESSPEKLKQAKELLKRDTLQLIQFNKDLNSVYDSGIGSVQKNKPDEFLKLIKEADPKTRAEVLKSLGRSDGKTDAKVSDMVESGQFLGLSAKDRLAKLDKLYEEGGQKVYEALLEQAKAIEEEKEKIKEQEKLDLERRRILGQINASLLDEAAALVRLSSERDSQVNKNAQSVANAGGRAGFYVDGKNPFTNIRGYSESELASSGASDTTLLYKRLTGNLGSDIQGFGMGEKADPTSEFRKYLESETSGMDITDTVKEQLIAAFKKNVDAGNLGELQASSDPLQMLLEDGVDAFKTTLDKETQLREEAIKQQQRQNALLSQIIDARAELENSQIEQSAIELGYRERVAERRGDTLSFEDYTSVSRQRMGQLNPMGLSADDIKARLDTLAEGLSVYQSMSNPNALDKAVESSIVEESNKLVEALKLMKVSTDELRAVEKELAQAQKKKELGKDLLKEFFGGGVEGRREILKQASAVKRFEKGNNEIFTDPTGKKFNDFMTGFERQQRILRTTNRGVEADENEKKFAERLAGAFPGGKEIADLLLSESRAKEMEAEVVKKQLEAAQALKDVAEGALKQALIGAGEAGLPVGGGFAAGGFVSGPGGPKDDKINAKLSNGEFVMTAEATQRIGAHNLHMLNSGGIPQFANGGIARKQRLAARAGMRGQKGTAEIYNARISSLGPGGGRMAYFNRMAQRKQDSYENFRNFNETFSGSNLKGADRAEKLRNWRKNAGFANGGLFGGSATIGSHGVNRSESSIQIPGLNMFALAIDKLAGINIPQNITMSGSHRVEVVLNGLSVLTGLEPMIRSIVQNEINNKVGKVIPLQQRLEGRM